MAALTIHDCTFNFFFPNSHLSWNPYFEQLNNLCENLNKLLHISLHKKESVNKHIPHTKFSSLSKVHFNMASPAECPQEPSSLHRTFKLSASIRETGCSNNSCKQINQGESGGGQRKNYKFDNVRFLVLEDAWSLARSRSQMCCFKISGAEGGLGSNGNSCYAIQGLSESGLRVGNRNMHFCQAPGVIPIHF